MSRSGRRDRGGIKLDYVALLVVVALIAGVVVTTVSDRRQQVTDTVAWAVCVILNSDGCEPPQWDDPDGAELVDDRTDEPDGEPVPVDQCRGVPDPLDPDPYCPAPEYEETPVEYCAPPMDYWPSTSSKPTYGGNATTADCTPPEGGGDTNQRSQARHWMEDTWMGDGEVWEEYLDQCTDVWGGDTMNLNVFMSWEDLGDGRVRLTGLTISNDSASDLHVGDINLVISGPDGDVYYQAIPGLGENAMPIGTIKAGESVTIDNLVVPGEGNILPLELDLDEQELQWSFFADPVDGPGLGGPADPTGRDGYEITLSVCGMDHQGYITG